MFAHMRQTLILLESFESTGVICNMTIVLVFLFYVFHTHWVLVKRSLIIRLIACTFSFKCLSADSFKCHH